MIQTDEFREVAVQAAKQTGKVIKENFGQVRDVRIKHGNWKDLVTNIDMKTNEMILKILKEKFPDHSIISEEAKPVEGNDYVWYVDPLDGTTNYTMAMPFSATCIGLMFKGKPVLGVVYNPMIDEMFIGEDGKGATLNGKEIRISGNNELKKTIVTFCHLDNEDNVRIIEGMFSYFKNNARDFRKLGAGNLEICYVGCGRNDVYIRPDNIVPHDIVPSYVIAKEAGARITDWKGNTWTLESKNILVTNGTRLHEEMIGIIDRLGGKKS